MADLLKRSSKAIFVPRGASSCGRAGPINDLNSRGETAWEGSQLSPLWGNQLAAESTENGQAIEKEWPKVVLKNPREV